MLWQIYPIMSLKVSNTLMTPYSYPIGHHSHSFVSKKGWKWFKKVFDSTYHHKLLFYTQVCSMGQQVVFNYSWYHPRCLLNLFPQIVTLWGTIATHLCAKIAKNSWKHVFVFGVTYLHNLFFYTQVCTMGQHVLFSYPMISPKVPTILMTLYSYPIGHQSCSFVNNNGCKHWKNIFLTMLTSIISFYYFCLFLLTNEWLWWPIG
jgi:hypothetical protein